ncbi:hypothetical protein [Vibrio crassostreae]|uniref:hypothetical protein n=1 Tax=Vibrio crassostreae TaxID=246167 RepID=UPI00104ABBB2|nr:hypothetical protein [Vibrio crassostreae]TCT61104.1 hypothetical protein EDB31_14525 [Vibrio crassostreae]
MSSKISLSKQNTTFINTIIPSKQYAVYYQSKESEPHRSLWSHFINAQEKPRDIYIKWLEQASCLVPKDEIDIVCISPTKGDFPSALIALLNDKTYLHDERALRPMGLHWQKETISSEAIINKLLQLEISLSDLPCTHRLIVHILKHTWLPFGLVSISNTKMSHNLSIKKEKIEQLLSWLCKRNLIEPNWEKSLCINRTFLKYFTRYPGVKRYITKHYQQHQFPSNYQLAKALLALRRDLQQLSYIYSTKEHEKRIQITNRFILEHYATLKGPLKKHFERLFLTNYQYELLNLHQHHSSNISPSVHPNEEKS